MQKTSRTLILSTLLAMFALVTAISCQPADKPDPNQNADVVTPEPGAPGPSLDGAASGAETGGSGTPMVSDSAP